MTAIILAGGKSRRMGFAKAFIKIRGIPLIKRQIKLLKTLFKEIIVVTNTPEKYRFRNTKVIKDVLPNCGSLGGIYSGLLASKDRYNFIIACDMPFVNRKVIKYMMQNLDNNDVVLTKSKEKLEPLCAFYSKDCIKPIEEQLQENNLRIRSFFSKVKSKIISEEEIDRFDRERKSFVNINTQEDYRKLL